MSGGAMAVAFWAEPIPTYDLAVFLFLPAASGALVSLGPIYSWAERHAYAVQAEHVIVEGVPTQFLPSPNPLSDEAIRAAAMRRYDLKL